MMPQSKFAIRLATQDDLETLVSFNLAMAEETEARVLERSRVRLGVESILGAPEKGFYLVAEQGQTLPGSVISQMMITFEWSDWRNGTFWWIQSVYVLPEWRRQGAYRRMHAWVQEQAKTQPNICGLRLYVESDNHLAQQVYSQVGLTPAGYRIYEEDFVLPKKPS